MPEAYHVRLLKEAFTFSAGHFITFGDGVCERLHGHNYAVSVEWAGRLDHNHYVVDFIALRDALAAITRELDHYVLLPTSHPQIVVREEGAEVTARFEDRRWVFPKGDCRLLPVANTTAELLAGLIGRRLMEAMTGAGVERPERLTVRVDECQGQQGGWEWTPDAEASQAPPR